MPSRLSLSVVVACAVAFCATSVLAQGALKAGAGKAVITPANPIWLAGYAARTAPSDGKLHDLFAKAIAIEDETGARTVVLAMDLLGLPAAMVRDLAARVKEKFGVPRERLMVTFTHTHSAPVIDADRTIDMYGLEETQAKIVAEYSRALPDLLLDAIGKALGSIEPCRLEYGIGTASFAINRRQPLPAGVTIGTNPAGPIDHDVPVLRIARADGTIKAVLFGYACHNTTLALQKICGDYAGYAQACIEERMPGAVALFVTGCGADQNPHPRRKIEDAENHGKALADAVAAVLGGPMKAVAGPVRAAYEEATLTFSAPPSRADIEKQLADQNIYVQRRARRLLGILDARGSLPVEYPYPVQVLKFGDALVMAALAGEVVVDYSLRLKRELGGKECAWIIGYANDFCAYIPSLRVLKEGGYEGGDAMVYFGFHGPWAPTVEENVVAAVHRLVARLKK
ncbi:MAG TPA: hypothetical protein DCM87_06095 [Planctomycetes bacterium]|nr:hypothetical protein [Planctomycetota bacterium]